MVGQQRQATSKVRDPDYQSISMVNSDNGSVGKPDLRPSSMGHQDSRKENNPDWQLTLKGNSRQISVEQPKEKPSPMGTNSKAPDCQPSPMGIEGKEQLEALQIGHQHQ